MVIMHKNLYIIEDDPEYAKALIEQLLACSFLTITGHASTLKEAFEHIKTEEDHLYLMDVSLPDGHTLELMSAIKKKYPLSKILVLSTIGDESYILNSLKAGANGYILKSELQTGLAQSLTSLVNGGGHLSSHASNILINKISKIDNLLTKESKTHKFQYYDILTKQEVEILELAKIGHPAKRIASALNISVFTVNQHLRSIYRKLGVRNKTAALAEARNYGIID